ncbi:MAG: DUF1264 domain-containing protein, partial [Nitrosopumilaceae archaeon]
WDFYDAKKSKSLLEPFAQNAKWNFQNQDECYVICKKPINENEKSNATLADLEIKVNGKLNNPKTKRVMLNFSLAIFAMAFSLILVAPSILDSFAEEQNFQCSEGMVLVYRVNSEKYACLKSSTADKWYEKGIAEPVQQIESFEIKYNEAMNPRQTEYPNHLGFNDLHIEAINHLIPVGDDSVLDMIVHHHCKVYDDMTAACLLFPTGMSDQDKPYGIEYVIGADAFATLPEEEKKYWHYHKTELPNVKATLPDLTGDEAEPLMPILNETYGKVVYFWQIGDEYPIGDPFVVMIQELYKDDNN